MVFLVLFSITPVAYCNNDEYEVGIAENSTIVWEVIDVDEDQIEYLLSVTDLDEDDFDYEEEDKIKYEINTISEVSDDEYYIISYDEYENDENQGARAERVAMDPGELAEDLEEDFQLDDYSITFILTDTEDYIDEVGDDVSDPYKPFVYTSGSSIILNSSVGDLFWLKMDYDEHGILEEISLVYNGQEIFNMELKSYTKSNQPPLFWIIIVLLLIIGAVIIVVVALVIVLTKKAKKKRPPKAPVLIKPATEAEPEKLTKTKIAPEAESKKELDKTKFCVNCGSERDTDAAYCTYCGAKF